METIKDRNGMDLIELEDIKKRWQEYTEELYKKDHDIHSHHFMGNKWGNNENNEKLYFFGLQNHYRW